MGFPCLGLRSAMAWGRVRSEGRRSVEKASDASRGRRVGRWSIETTVRGGPAVILFEQAQQSQYKGSRERESYKTNPGTSTVGLSKVVLIE